MGVALVGLLCYLRPTIGLTYYLGQFNSIFTGFIATGVAPTPEDSDKTADSSLDLTEAVTARDVLTHTVVGSTVLLLCGGIELVFEWR
jgi:hypothetical protein